MKKKLVKKTYMHQLQPQRHNTNFTATAGIYFENITTNTAATTTTTVSCKKKIYSYNYTYLHMFVCIKKQYFSVRTHYMQQRK